MDEAITVSKKLLKLNDEKDFCNTNEVCLALTYQVLGQAFFAKSEVDEAITNFNQSITLSSKSKYVDVLMDSTEGLGRSLIFKGITNRQPNNIKKGMLELDKVRQIYEKQGEFKKADDIQKIITGAGLNLALLPLLPARP